MNKIVDTAEDIVDAVEDALPKPHQLAVVVTGAVAAFAAKELTEKVYKLAYKAYKAKKATE